MFARAPTYAVPNRQHRVYRCQADPHATHPAPSATSLSSIRNLTILGRLTPGRFPTEVLCRRPHQVPQRDSVHSRSKLERSAQIGCVARDPNRATEAGRDDARSPSIAVRPALNHVDRNCRGAKPRRNPIAGYLLLLPQWQCEVHPRIEIFAPPQYPRVGSLGHQLGCERLESRIVVQWCESRIILDAFLPNVSNRIGLSQQVRRVASTQRHPQGRHPSR